MTAKKKNEDQKVNEARTWYFPTLGVSVQAVTEEEALVLAEKQLESESEEGDD